MAARTHRWRVTLMKTLARMRQEYVQEDYTLWLLEKQRMVSREMKTRTQDTLTFRCLSAAYPVRPSWKYPTSLGIKCMVYMQMCVSIA
jgi:hypothetical protein